ncbi:hypothetical protein SLS62_001539 [Diatrype stigma]|uniref:Lipoprotein n=1 Tax=Diatrype stigma TaxID=117547 RepID=A0AAN9UXS3_9PEZI
MRSASASGIRTAVINLSVAACAQKNGSADVMPHMVLEGCRFRHRKGEDRNNIDVGTGTGSGADA